MKKLLILMLLVVGGIAFAGEESITFNLRFNNQLPGLENADLVNLISITPYDRTTETFGTPIYFDKENEQVISLSPNETHATNIPALGTYAVNAFFYDNQDNLLSAEEADAHKLLIDVKVPGETIDIPFVPES